MTSSLFASRTQTLANGLRVVAHEDRTSPVVAVHLMYHVGSRHEPPGRTGLAHLLEHLLFEGTEHVPKGKFDEWLEGVGGTNNGSTWFDRTAYHETVPTNAVELALWLERDRMTGFLPALDAEMLELQRGVVINERREAYENRPYGMADERLHQMLFPGDHPYSWPTIGYVQDLKAVSLEDARGFYGTYYTPSNAVLVLAGDLPADEAFALAEKYFVDLAPSAVPHQSAALTPGSPAVAWESLPDAVSFPRVYRAYAVPPYGRPDWVALDVLAYVLADGDSSRLQRALVREVQLAQDVDTYLYPTELVSVFGITATARSGVSAAALQEQLDAALAKAIRDGLSDEEVAGAIRRARRDRIGEVATVEGRAEELAYATLALGSPDRLEEVLEQYTRITPDEVHQAAARCLGAGTTLHVLPDGNG